MANINTEIDTFIKALTEAVKLIQDEVVTLANSNIIEKNDFITKQITLFEELVNKLADYEKNLSEVINDTAHVKEELLSKIKNQIENDLNTTFIAAKEIDNDKINLNPLYALLKLLCDKLQINFFENKNHSHLRENLTFFATAPTHITNNLTIVDDLQKKIDAIHRSLDQVYEDASNPDNLFSKNPIKSFNNDQLRAQNSAWNKNCSDYQQELSDLKNMLEKPQASLAEIKQTITDVASLQKKIDALVTKLNTAGFNVEVDSSTDSASQAP